MATANYTTEAKVYMQAGISSSDVAEATVTQFIEWSESEIEERVGERWTTAASVTEQFDIREIEYHKDPVFEGGAIIGTKPFMDKHTTILLNTTPVTDVESVRFLTHDLSIEKLFSYDSNAGTYTDNTDEANSVRGTPFNAFASTVAIGDILYVSCPYRFTGVVINLFTAGVDGVIAWEYYNGTSWTAVSGLSESASGADDLNANGSVTWTLPNDWEESSVNSSSDLFWIRARVTTAHSTSPTVNFIGYSQNAVIYDELETYDFQWNVNGRLVILSDYPNSGFDYVEVRYNAGATSAGIPKYVDDLTANLAAQRCLQSLMGGSGDEVATGGLADENWTKGEPYVSYRATMVELRRMAEKLWNLIGERNFFVST